LAALAAGILVVASIPDVLAAAAGEQTVEDRIRPVGQVRITGQAAEEAPAAAAPAAERTGKEVVDQACAACHTTGAAGAPKVGDKAAWAPRLEQGFDTLASHAINGFKAMPARGGNPTLTDTEVQRGVAYLVEQVGMKVKLPESKPAAAAPAASPAPGAPAEPSAAATPATAAPAAPAAAATPATPAAVASAAPAAGEHKANLERGENTYKQACSACHLMGVAGAPKVGDKEAWGPRIQQGLPTLNQHALQGIRAMPPKGGRVDLPDDVVLDAVAFMVGQSS
jgi:cytochrome c5